MEEDFGNVLNAESALRELQKKFGDEDGSDFNYSTSGEEDLGGSEGDEEPKSKSKQPKKQVISTKAQVEKRSTKKGAKLPPTEEEEQPSAASLSDQTLEKAGGLTSILRNFDRRNASKAVVPAGTQDSAAAAGATASEATKLVLRNSARAPAATSSTSSKLMTFGEAMAMARKAVTPQDKTPVSESGIDVNDLAGVPRPWYDLVLPLRQLSLNEISSFSLPIPEIQKLHSEAEQAYQKEVEYQKQKSPWLFGKMLTEGTTADRIRSLAIQLSDHGFIWKLHLIESLLGICEKAHRDSKVSALDAITDLWIKVFLPKARKLRDFVSQPLAQLPDATAAPKDRKQVLMYWYVEDKLKRLFRRFVQVLTEGVGDSVVHHKSLVMKVVYRIICEVPEEEAVLLNLLIEKLGDKIPMVAAKAFYLLTCLSRQHPRMKTAIACEVERFLFRKNNPVNARFYGASVLSMFHFVPHERELLTRVLSVYVAMFKHVIFEGEVEHRIMTTLLRGVGKIMPYLLQTTNPRNRNSRRKPKQGETLDVDPQQEAETQKVIEEHYQTLFTIAACGAFPRRVQALCLLWQMVSYATSGASIRTRFYTSLYRLLRTMPWGLPTNEKLAVFFSLLYRALGKLADRSTVMSFVHRLLQMCQHQCPAFICSALLTLSELCNVHPSLRAWMLSPTPTSTPIPTTTTSTSTSEGEGESKGYRPEERYPDASHGDLEHLWLLDRLSHHYHPSVVRFSIYVMQGLFIRYPGNPLVDFTLYNFLEQFLYKKPRKKVIRMLGSSSSSSSSQQQQQQPEYRHAGVGVGVGSVAGKAEGRARPLYNSERFRSLPADRLEIDEIFFYKFQKLRQDSLARQQKDHKGRTGKGEDSKIAAKESLSDDADADADADDERQPRPIQDEGGQNADNNEDKDEDEDVADPHDLFHQYSYADLDDREVGGGGGGNDLQIEDEEDSQDSQGDDEDNERARGLPPKKRHRKNKPDKEEEDAFDVVRGGPLKPRDATVHAADFSALMERTRAHSQRASRFATSRRQRGMTSSSSVGAPVKPESRRRATKGARKQAQNVREMARAKARRAMGDVPRPLPSK